MTIQEQNVVIAEFENRFFYGHPISSFGGDTGNALPEMKYHHSWDWLMPVVNKIEQTGYDSRIMGNNRDGGFLCDFLDFENTEAACSVSYNTKIEAVYNACVQFIQWYNTLKK